MLRTITPEQLLDLRLGGQRVVLLDVRTPAEFQEVHVDFALNVPLDQLDPVAIHSERKGDDDPIYVICRSGSRGQQACAKLASV